MDYKLACTKCGHVEGYGAFRCSVCNSLLEVSYDYYGFKLQKNFGSGRISTEKYSAFLPVKKFVVKGGEGNTAMLRMRIGSNNIRLKLETENPTHSFKDRGSVVELNIARELGYGRVCCASTGNMGISIARYARLAGVKATIFISKDANSRKIGMIKKHGASVVKVNGDFNRSMKRAEDFATKNGAFLCGDYHYRKEGQKTLLFEMIEQSKYKVPDFIFVAIGNATLLAGVYKALLELERFSMIKKFPRIVAVQSDGCNPLVRAYNSGKRIKYMKPRTAADAIAVGYPTFGPEGLDALKRTNGLGASVSEDRIKDAVVMLKEEGISSEPGGATGFAGYLKLLEDDRKLLAGKDCVVLITGNN